MKSVLLFITLSMALNTQAKFGSLSSSFNDDIREKIQNIPTETVILRDRETGTMCLVDGDMQQFQGISLCDEEQLAEASRIDNMPKNLKVAGAGKVVKEIVNAVISIYAACSAVEFSPKFLRFLRDKAFDIEPDFVGDIQRGVNSITNEEYQKASRDINQIEEVTELISGSICLPVSASNAELIKIKNGR